MIPDIGYFLLCTSIILSIIVAIFPIKRSTKTYFIISVSVFNIFSFLVLLYLFLVSDLRVITVLMHSSTLLDFRYKISGCWSSHEASMLFWLFLNSIVAIFFILNTNFSKFYSYIVNMIIQTIFTIYIIRYANPFKYIDSVPNEGLGLNPSLQDVGMMVHPPILFLAYSIYQIIFSLILASIFNESVEDSLLQRFSRYGLSLLIFAVGLGGWWAYRELGWGGYWFFDPVENISLVILLLGISYHHTILQKNMNFSKNIIGILPFLSSIIGTFLVRSGFLNSVHSFAESNGSLFMLIIALIISFCSIILVVWKSSNVNNEQYSRKYFFMQGANVVWIFSTIIIVIGISIPIFTSLFGDDIFEVKEEFYISKLLPIMLIGGGLSGTVYFNRSNIKLAIFLTVPIIIGLIAKYFGSSNIISFGYYISFLIIIGTLYRYYERFKESRLNKAFLSMILGHLFFGILILAISLNNDFSYSKEYVLNKGEKSEFRKNISVKLSDIKYSASKNHLREIVQINLIDGEKEVAILRPELRFYPIEKSLSSEVDIFSFLFADWYSVINNIEKNTVSFKIVYQPMISFIWMAIFFCGFATIMRNVI